MDLVESTERPRTDIHSMPPEIMHRIFALHMHPEVSPDHVSRFREGVVAGTTYSLSLSSVCMRWRDIALSIPWFWADFVIGRMTQLKFLTFFMKRAKGAHLRFTFQPGAVNYTDHWNLPDVSSPWFHPLQKATWEPALQHIRDHLDVTIFLDIGLWHVKDVNTLKDAFKGASAPVLRTLWVDVPEECMHIPIQTCPFLTPSLREINISQQPDDWGSPAFSNLTRFDFFQRRVPKSSRSRLGDLQINISPSKIACLLSVARKLVYLNIYDGFIAPDEIASGRPSFQVALKDVSIRTRFTDRTAFDQICDVISVEDIPFGAAPMDGIARLLAGLRGITVSVYLHSKNSNVPDTSEIITSVPWYDSAQLGSWVIIMADSDGNSRYFGIGEEEWFARGTMLKNALSPVADRVVSLHIHAGQWQQLSAGLQLMALDKVEYLEVVFLADLAFPRDETHPLNSFPEKIETVYLPDISGDVISFPALKFLIVRCARTIPDMDVFLPLHITTNGAKNIRTKLCGQQRLELIEWHDIIPDNDETCDVIEEFANEVLFFDGALERAVSRTWGV